MHLRRWLYSSGMSFFASSLGIPRPSSKLGGMGNTRPGDAKLYTTVVLPTPGAALPGMRRLLRSHTRFWGGREACVSGVG
ncbi:hypothetical protein LY76DRAFT_597304 [Colletotrichum caudatum]|nr:hypothetical protein LY76DRAFT_597304 [Colletotrichum caudatum]